MVALVAPHGIFTGLVPSPGRFAVKVVLADERFLNRLRSFGINFLLPAGASRFLLARTRLFLSGRRYRQVSWRLAVSFSTGSSRRVSRARHRHQHACQRQRPSEAEARLSNSSQIFRSQKLNRHFLEPVPFPLNKKERPNRTTY